MANNINKSKGRKYTYPYRPFFWSLHVKSSIVAAEGKITDNRSVSPEEDL